MVGLSAVGSARRVGAGLLMLIVGGMLTSLAGAAETSAKIALNSVINGPGVYNLAAGSYEGSVSLNLAPGQTAEIRGSGITFSRPDGGPIFFVQGGGTLSFSSGASEGIVFDSTTARAVDASGSTVTFTNVSFRNHNDIAFVNNGAEISFTSCLGQNIGSGIIVTGGAVRRISMTGCWFRGRGRGNSNSKLIQFQNIVESVSIDTTTIESFDIGIVKQDNGTAGAQLVMSNSRIRNTNAGLLLLQSNPSAVDTTFATITNTVFGDETQPFPLAGANTKGIQVNGPGRLRVEGCTFRNWIFGIQAIDGPAITVVDSVFSDSQNGIQGQNFDLVLQKVNTGNVFVDLRTVDSNPARGIIVSQTAGTAFPAQLTMNPGVRFVNIWDPSVNNGQSGLDEFSHGDGININGGASLTLNGSAEGDFYFERVGRCITVANGLLEIDYAFMKDCVRGILLSDAGNQQNRVRIRNNYFNAENIDYVVRHDAISASRSVLEIYDNYINFTGGGIVFVDSNDGNVYRNTVLNAKRNSFTCANSTRAEVYDNYFQTTIGNPAENTGLDNIYVDRSANVRIYQNMIMDSQDNGVFVEGSDAYIFNNFIAGQANDGILVVRSERPGVDRTSFVRAHDNTLMNQGNFAFKLLPDNGDIQIYRNIATDSSGAAAPSLRIPSSFAPSKLRSGLEANSRQTTMAIRGNVFLNKSGIGAEFLNAAVNQSGFAILSNNAFVNTGQQGIKLFDTISKPFVEKNFLLNNAGIAPVEFSNAAPIFSRNVFGAFTNSRLFYSNALVSVENNYWGRPEGPGNPLIAENGDFTPFITTQNIFFGSASNLAPPTAVFSETTNTRVGVTVTLPAGSEATGSDHTIAVTRFVNDEFPEGLTPLSGANSYILPLIDWRLRAEAASITFSVLLPNTHFHEIQYYDENTSTWRVLTGVQRSGSGVTGFDRYSATFPGRTMPNAWYAVRQGGVIPPTVGVFWGLE